MNVDKVLLAAPRGFCAGVEMAIKALSWLVRSFDGPVYCYHEIVHNRLVVKRFEEAGVIFVDDVSEVPQGRPLMLSAHGTAPEVVDTARRNGGFVVNAVCPLVTKVHHEVRTRANEGYSIIYVGHDGHEESVGTMAVAPDSIHLVEHDSDVANLPEFDKPVALLAQTTLSHKDWFGVVEAARDRFSDLWTPGRSDLCFATTNRQNALTALVKRCDHIVVIGSANSSNTMALAKLAADLASVEVWRVNSAEELGDEITGVVGVTAGASAPEQLVQEVIECLGPLNGVEEVAITDEDEYFPLPRDLRGFLSAVEIAMTVVLGGDLDGRPELRDREASASDVLAALS